MQDEAFNDHERVVHEIESGMSILYDMSVALYSVPFTQPIGAALVEWSAIWLNFMVGQDVITRDEADAIVETVAGPDPRESVEPTEPVEFHDEPPMTADEVLDMLKDIESL